MSMDGVQIKDLKDGMICDGTYILKEVDVKKTAAGKTYIDMTLMDNTGEINAKDWNGNQTTVSRLVQGKLHRVNSKVALWQGSLQMNINSINLSDEQTQNRISEFVPSAPIPPEEMFEMVRAFIDSIGNEDMKKLVKSIYNVNADKLKYYPAAKALHHAIRGGLLYHILTMLQTAKKLKEVYYEIDLDLLYTGVLLHDIMKLRELDSNEVGIAEYSIEGQLIGHIEMGISLIDEKAKELNLNKNVTLLIKHMILSHHYLPEHGSPKSPMFLEAELLHFIDLIDARVYDFNQCYNTIMPGEVTDKIWSLDRRIYRPDY
ncbi:MAG: HD domain-containing protein [Clostridia bacterium]|nr:HD domain-containing protein [Clostridia bacterium]